MRCELHFHLLPGVDDGPRDMGETLELARRAVEDGTTRIVATPHVRQLRLEELEARVEEVRAELARARLPLEVEVGGEIAKDDVARLSDAELKLISHGPANGSWVLLEAPLRASVDELHEAADAIRARGHGVLLAHPERCAGLFLEAGRPLGREVSAGSRLLLNASSLVGGHGPLAETRAFELLRSGLATAIASDAHSPARPPRLSRAIATLDQAGFAPEQIDAWVNRAPCELLDSGFRSAE